MDKFDLLKSHIEAYTRKDGAVVHAHDDKRQKMTHDEWAAGVKSKHGNVDFRKDAKKGVVHAWSGTDHVGSYGFEQGGKPAWNSIAEKASGGDHDSDGVAGDVGLDHPAYNTPAKVKGYTSKHGITATQAVTPEDAAKVLIKNNPEWSKEDHRKLSDAHRKAANDHEQEWDKTADEAAQQKWGRNFKFGDYKISGIGSDEFSSGHKEKLRNHAHSQTAHRKLADAHAAAAKSRATK